MKHIKDRAGFTLVELLVVIAMIMILSTFVAVNLMNEPVKAKIAAANAQVDSFKLAVKVYRTDNGIIPTEEQGLQALIEIPQIDPIPMHYPEGEGYLESLALPLDPWGNDYVYLSPGSHGEKYEIICYGADGEPGGENENADISSSDI